jgi:hypothetical protein
MPKVTKTKKRVRFNPYNAPESTVQPTKRRRPDDNKDSTSLGFSFEKKQAPQDLSISPVPTSKDKIEQPELAEHEDMYIPPRGSSVVISGKSGSGKSTLLARFITDERFYGPSAARPNGWFDKIFLFSPTANGDDVQKALGIDKKFVFTDLDEAPELLEVILDSQQKKLDTAEGADRVEQYAIIFDDVIGDTGFMNERAFTRCFYQVRHVNCTTFICTQHFKRVPKVCRLQANFIFFFQGSASEVEIVTEEFAPPEYSKKEFATLVNDATKEPYSFLTINMKVGWDKRFRRRLDEFIRLDRLTCEEGGEGQTCNDKKKKEYEEDNEEEKRQQLFENTNSVIQKDPSKYGANEQTSRWGAPPQATGGRAGWGYSGS